MVAHVRIGLIADIHGNLVALRTVLTELEHDRVDQTVCLGDLAALGPQPDEVVSLVRKLGISTVCGNTDGWLVPGHPIPAQAPESEPVHVLTSWASSRITPQNLDFLRGLPLTLSLHPPGNASVLCFHGSPASVDDIITDGNSPGVGEPAESILVSGHTHVQEVRRFGDRFYINPGSVGLPGIGPGTPGLPVNRNVAWAEYAVLEIGEGRIEIILRRIPLAMDLVRDAVIRSGMPYQDWWSGLWA